MLEKTSKRMSFSPVVLKSRLTQETESIYNQLDQ